MYIQVCKSERERKNRGDESTRKTVYQIEEKDRYRIGGNLMKLKVGSRGVSNKSEKDHVVGLDVGTV